MSFEHQRTIGPPGTDREFLKNTYELQDVSASPTRRLRHHQQNDVTSHSAEKNYSDTGDSEPEAQLSPGQQSYTAQEEKAVTKKLDRHLVLFIAFLYLLGFLDRSNIGNARIAGVSEDLDLTSDQYEWVLRSFYITYVLFEWMPILYTVLTPSTYIALCVFFWGIIASLQALATSYASLCILRLLLGISEAAFSPGVPVYLAFFYKRDELAYRIGLFISAAPLATSFASSLAWLITKVGERSSIAPWRLLFLVEGLPSVVVSVFAWFYVPDSPGEAKYLSKRERRVAVLRLKEGKPKVKHEHTDRRFQWNEIWEALKDPKCYLTALMFCSCNVAFSSLPVFLPTIINDMGYSALRSQILSAPPYLLAFFIVLSTASLSDRYENRSLFICFHAFLAAFGYTAIAIAGMFEAGPTWRYLGVYPAASGFFSAVTLLITWTINNQESDAKKGTGVAILNVIGQLGPFIGTALYPESDKPFYVRGMTACALFMLLVDDEDDDTVDEAADQTGLTPSASGSAYFELEPSSDLKPPNDFTRLSSSLKLTCTVHGPRPLPRSVPFSPYLLLSANVKFAPFASRHRRGYVRDVSERDLAVHVETALRGLLISERWPKSGVDVIITVLEGEDDEPQAVGHDIQKEEGVSSGWGMMSVLSGCITVASAAIADAGIDCVDLASGGVAAIVRQPTPPGPKANNAPYIVLDPCPAEHVEILAVCVVGYLRSRDEITELWTRGDVGSLPTSGEASFEDLVDRAVEAAVSSRLVLAAALEAATKYKLEAKS
ncbi:MAG: hypothetical protein Q9183_003849 [Haloplaca sp. 2 TL-2023]